MFRPAIFLSLLLCINCYIVDPGPLFPPTKGEVWPLVANRTKNTNYFIVRPLLFEFQAVGGDCTILQQAFSRYWNILNSVALSHFGPVQKLENDIFKKRKYLKKLNYKRNDYNLIDFLDILNVNLVGKCEDNDMPYYNMDESYTLNLEKGTTELKSNSIWGILRGLETFSQLVYVDDDTITLKINATYIEDYPRYSHRGLLLDTARHFISVKRIYETLDAMAYNKLNVFHWHITDDQSFPYKSIKFPNMSQLGAYHPISKVYEQVDIKGVIEYARLRGIRVIPEFDTPGHTRSWGEAIDNLLTECYNDGVPTGQFGPIDPTRDATYSFLKDFFEEVVEVFPDKYLHLGGDEVEFECWMSNERINEFMEKHNITNDYAALESYYIQKLLNIVKYLNTSYVVWEEVFNNGIQLPDEAIVHVWIESNYKKKLQEVTENGKQTILSACYYLDHLSTGGDWLAFYIPDPANFTGTDEQKKLIMGGEAAMWTEVVDDNNIISRIWPRASAVAERLWSVNAPNLNLDENGDLNIINLSITGKLTSATDEVARRLEEHTCRMNKRGIEAQPPSGPGVCL